MVRRLGDGHDEGAVDETVGPVFAGFDGAGDVVAGVLGVLAGVAIGGGVAAGDVAAGEAHAQVDPAAAGGEAVFAAEAAGGRGGEPDEVFVGAEGHGISWFCGWGVFSMVGGIVKMGRGARQGCCGKEAGATRRAAGWRGVFDSGRKGGIEGVVWALARIEPALRCGRKG